MENEDDTWEANRENLCVRIFKCIFSSRATNNNLSDKERQFQVHLKELIVYVVFLVTLSVVIYGTVTPYQYYYTQSVQTVFVDGASIPQKWTEVQSWDNFWEYLETSLLNGIHDNQINQNLYIYNENKLLSLPRLRQLKVKNSSCEIPPVFSTVLFNCYNAYHREDEHTDTLNFVSYYADQSNGSKFYQDRVNTISYVGELARYSSGGYTQLLSSDKNISSFILHDLKYNAWVDRSTRAVFVDFALYNANINMFCIVKLVAEFLPTGGVSTSYTIQVQKLLRYVSTHDTIILGFEIALIVLVFYYIMEEMFEIVVLKFAYFLDIWNVLDCLIVAQILTGIGISLYRGVTINGLVTETETNPDKFVSFEAIAYYESIYNDLAAICLFFSWIKIFKYINFNRTMRHFSVTLSRCSKDILSFAVMFFIIFFAFAQLGLLLFGTTLRDFSTFHDSTYTLFRIILGDFDFLALETASKILGPVFFIVYVFTVFFILLNMFLAIINDTYSEVKSELNSESAGLEFGGYIKRNFKKIFRICGVGGTEDDDEGDDSSEVKKLPQEAPSGGDHMDTGQLVPSDDDDTVDSMFDDHDFQSERSKRVPRTQETLCSYINNQWDAQSTMDFGPRGLPSRYHPSYEEFKILCRRVDRNDDAMGSVISKIDAVLSKLEILEKSNVKGMFPVIEEIPFPDGLEDEQTIHIPDETDQHNHWT